IGGASGYFLASLSGRDAGAVWNLLRRQALERSAEVTGKVAQLTTAPDSYREAQNLWRHYIAYERSAFASLKTFVKVSDQLAKEASTFYTHLANANGVPSAEQKTTGVIYRRNPDIKGPMSVFGVDYFDDHYGAEKASRIRLLSYEGSWG